MAAFPDDWPDDLAAPSSLMSSRWSRDNLLTSDPSQLYSGRVLQRIDVAMLERLLEELSSRVGPLQIGAGGLGVFTWNVSCEGDAGPFVLQVPLCLDEPGRRGRSRAAVPGQNVQNMGAFVRRGLTRFVAPPRQLLTLGGNVPAALLSAFPEYRTLTFGAGAIRVDSSDGERCWAVALGGVATAELLAEMVAALVYHYEPEEAGGTAIADVFINDGDFVARRRGDGTYELRLLAARQLETGIGPSLLLLYLIQLMAYEDWSADGKLIGVPVLLSNPSVAFEGLRRGLRYRYRDLGRAEEDSECVVQSWLQAFSRSREGHAYRPWVDRFLRGRLPLEFGSDPREHWWRLTPLRQKQELLLLRAEGRADSAEAVSARAVGTVLSRLSRELGRSPEGAPDALRVNELSAEALTALLHEAGVPPGSRGALVAELLTSWPYRGLDELLARVPRARALAQLKARLSFGGSVSEEDEGTLKSLGKMPKVGETNRILANPEAFGRLDLPLALHAAARESFPTFEEYMDGALHDREWGYYSHHVLIGLGGHFTTNPERFSPRYGGWVARLAFRAWRQLRARGELREAEAFTVVEFGAGNGRLAHDFLDALQRPNRSASETEQAEWSEFGALVQYQIYEVSPALTEKQQTLLGQAARIFEGDARSPGETLRRDFPAGLKGMVVTNEVPDAFGVHKVVLARDGKAHVALVLPRVEQMLLDALSEELRREVRRVDGEVRSTFQLTRHAEAFYLDRASYRRVMSALSTLLAAEREVLVLSALWFEELYIAASFVPELAEHFRVNAAQYALALAADSSGVVQYVNVHADRFIREVGQSLVAGHVVTIDYGDSAWELMQASRRGEFPFRIYFDGEDYIPRPNDPYSVPGGQDLTADVNFTALGLAGEAVGLHVVHFSHEREIAGSDLPELLASVATNERHAEFLGNPVFKLLIQGTHPDLLLGGQQAMPLSLLRRPEDVPKAQRGRIEALKRALLAP